MKVGCISIYRAMLPVSLIFSLVINKTMEDTADSNKATGDNNTDIREVNSNMVVCNNNSKAIMARSRRS